MDVDKKDGMMPGADEGAGAPDAGEPDAERAGDAAPTDDERLRAVVEELRRLKVDDLALDMAVSLVTIGYQKLGLTEQTSKLRDLDGARLSIELLRAILDVLEREGAAAKSGDLRATLAAMQLNYARVVADRAAGDADAAPQTPPAQAAGEPSAGSPA
jgi:hypothetical protein